MNLTCELVHHFDSDWHILPHHWSKPQLWILNLIQIWETNKAIVQLWTSLLPWLINYSSIHLSQAILCTNLPPLPAFLPE